MKIFKLPQLASSIPSAQSFLPSHLLLLSTQEPSLHIISPGLHTPKLKTKIKLLSMAFNYTYFLNYNI